METWNMRKSNTPLRLDRGHELVDSGIISPVTLTFTVTSLQHCDLASFSRLLLLDTNTECRQPCYTIWTFGISCTIRHGPVIVLATESHGYQVGSSCFDLQQLDGVMTGRQLLCSYPVTFHVSPLCFRGFDLHVLDESDRSE